MEKEVTLTLTQHEVIEIDLALSYVITTLFSNYDESSLVLGSVRCKIRNLPFMSDYVEEDSKNGDS